MHDQSTHPQPTPTATLHRAGDRVIRIDIAGAIDLTSVDVLDDALTAALGQQPHTVLVNLAHLTFMDTTGVRALTIGYDGLDRVRSAHGDQLPAGHRGRPARARHLRPARRPHGTGIVAGRHGR